MTHTELARRARTLRVVYVQYVRASKEPSFTIQAQQMMDGLREELIWHGQVLAQFDYAAARGEQPGTPAILVTPSLGAA